MATPSPEQMASSLIAFDITVNGAPLDSSYQIQSIEVWRDLDRLPKARLVIQDGDPAAETFPISEGTALIPGVALTISLGYDGQTTRVFTGVIYRQGLEVSAEGGSSLVVEATDKAMAMTLARGNAVFKDVTDSSVCEALIEAAGLTPKVTATSVRHAFVVQYYASAWDLLVMRAQLSGMGVDVDGGVVTVAAPNTAATPVLALTYGQSILDLQIEMDAATQVAASAVQSVSLDPATQAVVTGKTPAYTVSTPGNLSSATLAEVFGVKALLLQTGGDLDAEELTGWSSAELQRRQLAKIRGKVRFQGSALATVGCLVTLAGLGSRFNGDAFVSGVHHSVRDGVWLTTVEVGRTPAWFAATAPRIAAPGASGLLPPIGGLQSGKVTQIDKDPEDRNRVLVSLPILAPDGGTLWAWVGGFLDEASAHWPKVGDEVLLAFLNDDPRFPVVVGRLHTPPPPSPPPAPPSPPEASAQA